VEGEALAALYSPKAAPSAVAWRPSGRRRAAVAALALLAFGLAVAFIGTAPPAPFADDVPLPLLVLVGGTLVAAAQWRRLVSVTSEEVIVRTMVRTRRIPLHAVVGVGTDGPRVTIRLAGGGTVVIRSVTGQSAADDLANALVAGAGPRARLADDLTAAPVPMLTPWLISLLMVCVAIVAADLLTPRPVLIQRPAATSSAVRSGPGTTDGGGVAPGRP
jgi:hypothetical protein